MKGHVVRAPELSASVDGWVIAHTITVWEGKRILARKGDVLTATLRGSLSAAGDIELHVLEPEPGDIHENLAGERLVRAVSGSGVHVRGPSESQYELLANHRGLLRIDVDALRDLNALDGISILTRFDAQPVNEGEPLAGVKVTPILIPERTIERAEALARRQPPIEVVPFRSLRVGVLVAERVEHSSLARFRAALTRKLDWFGGHLDSLEQTDNELSAFIEHVSALVDRKLDIIMVAGASSLDPMEPLFQALNQLNARMVKHGVPVHPGSLFWIAEVRGTPVFGLSSCEMFSHKTILDLVLTRVFAGAPVTREALIELGHGGMLGQEMAFRFPPYS